MMEEAVNNAMNYAVRKLKEGLLIDDEMSVGKMDWSAGDPETIHSIVSLYSDDLDNDGSWEVAIYNQIISEFPWLVRSDKWKYYQCLKNSYKNIEEGEILPAEHYPVKFKNMTVGRYVETQPSDWKEVYPDDFYVFDQAMKRACTFFNEKHSLNLVINENTKGETVDKSIGESCTIRSIASKFGKGVHDEIIYNKLSTYYPELVTN